MKTNSIKNNLYIQYGCGWNAPENWRNFDASPTLIYERLLLIGRIYTKNENRFPENVEYGDIIKGLPVPEQSCELIYCSHVLEHLSLQDLRIALKNTYKILRPGGIFRFVIPDLEYAIKQYINDKSEFAALNFMKNTLLGKEKRVRGLKGLFLEWLGNSQHLWMWDYKSIKKELEEVGFKKIRRAFYGDYENINFKDVENYERWKNCLGVECQK